jgi:hypothetical protein
MATYFLDTSALVKRYVAEVGSAWVTALSDPSAGNVCQIAAATQVELLAALYRRVRIGSLPLVQAQRLEQQFRHELATHFQVIGLNTAIVADAMRLVAALPLRAYDALQLATALYLHTLGQPLGLPAPTFLSSDQSLNQAALSQGLPCDDPNAHP